MALQYGIFTGRKIGEANGIPISDRAVDSIYLARLHALLYRNGLFLLPQSNGAVQAGGRMTLTLSPVDILIEGYYAYDLYASTLALPPADGLLTKTYAIGYRVNLPQRLVEHYYHEVQEKSAAALQRDADIHELCLAWVSVPPGATEITAAQIEDAREDSTVCGIVTAAILSADPANMFLQQQALLNQLRDELAAVNDGSLFAVVIDDTATLSASGWSDTAPYTQTVDAPRMAALYEPIVDIVLTGTAEDKAAQLEAWSSVSEIVTGEGTITAVCLEDRPDCNIQIRLKAVT